MPRDYQRGRVYAAEQRVRDIFDRRDPNRPVIDFCGTSLTLPPEKKFSSLEQVQQYVDTLLANIADKFGTVISPVIVRARKGQRAAHYEIRDQQAYLAIPDGDSHRWALRELVILHELAHHLSSSHLAHGPEFTCTFTRLVEHVMGPEAGYLLRVIFSHEQVQ